MPLGTQECSRNLGRIIIFPDALWRKFSKTKQETLSAAGRVIITKIKITKIKKKKKKEKKKKTMMMMMMMAKKGRTHQHLLTYCNRTWGIHSGPISQVGKLTCCCKMHVMSHTHIYK